LATTPMTSSGSSTYRLLVA